MKVIDKTKILATTRKKKNDSYGIREGKDLVKRVVLAMNEFDAIPLDRVKQAREEIENIGLGSYLEVIKEIECNDREVRLSKKFATAILDKLIAESEE